MDVCGGSMEAPWRSVEVPWRLRGDLHSGLWRLHGGPWRLRGGLHGGLWRLRGDPWRLMEAFTLYIYYFLSPTNENDFRRL